MCISILIYLCLLNRINGYQVATTVKTSYCEMQIAPDSVGRVNIGAIYQQSNSSLSSPVMFHTGKYYDVMIRCVLIISCPFKFKLLTT